MAERGYRNADHSWTAPGWFEARCLESLEGRAEAEKVWGPGYYLGRENNGDRGHEDALVESLRDRVKYLEQHLKAALESKKKHQPRY